MHVEIIKAINEELMNEFPNSYIVYHYNPKAIIKGPMITFNIGSWGDQTRDRGDNNVILIINGCIVYLIQEPLPVKIPKRPLWSWDVSDPNWSVKQIIDVLYVYYSMPVRK
jgi:hypothetical protein